MFVKFCCIFLIIYSTICIATKLVNFTFNRWIFLILNIFFSISFVSLVCLYIPNEMDDASRYIYYMNKMEGMSFLDALSLSPYVTEYIFNFLLFISINVFHNVTCLRLIICTLSIIIYFAIMYEVGKKDIYSMISYYLMIISTVLLYFFASGLRSFAAALFFTYAIYLYKIDKKFFSFFFSIIAIGIHNVILIPISIFIIYKVFGKRRFVEVLLVVWSIFSSLICKILMASNNYFLSYLGRKTYTYLFDIQTNVDFRLYFVQLIILLILTIYYFRYIPIRKRDTFIEYMLLFNYGCIVNYTFFERMLRINIFLSIFIIKNVKKEVRSFCFINFASVFVAIIMLIYQMVNVSSNMNF